MLGSKHVTGVNWWFHIWMTPPVVQGFGFLSTLHQQFQTCFTKLLTQ